MQPGFNFLGFLVSTIVLITARPIQVSREAYEAVPASTELAGFGGPHAPSKELVVFGAAPTPSTTDMVVFGEEPASTSGDVVVFGQDSSHTSEVAIYDPRALTVRGKPGEDVTKAGKIVGTVGDVLGKVAPEVDALGPVGEAIGTALQVVSTFMKILGKILEGIGEAQRQDAAARGEFTKKVADQTLKKHPGWNVVVVKPKHSINFQGNEGPDWAHEKTSLKTHEGTIHFEVYSARAGIFENQGDGGWQNWAWAGTHVKAVGDQNHRLIFSGKPPNNHPASGTCGMHITQYQKNEKSANPVNHYTLNMVIKDAKGVVVGFSGDGDPTNGLSVGSQLKDAVVIKAGPVDKDPLSFKYGKDSWDSNDKKRCSVGGYDSGSRQMDCTFNCKF